MKIVAVLGSPRPRGNSSTLAHRFLDTARELGAETRIFPLNQMTFQGCQGCRTCKTKTDNCCLEDDLAEVLAAIKEADVLVLASPVYYGDLSGQMKCFIDRTYSYLDSDFSSRLPAGKKAVMILVQAQPDETMYADIFPRYERFLKWYGFDPVYLLRATGVRDLGDIEPRTALLGRAAALAHEII
jgi:multimeric flavodoxin WrbA